MAEMDNNSVRVYIDDDHLTAEMTVPESFDRAMLSLEYLQGVLIQQQVEVTTDVREALQQLLDQALQTDETLTATIAEAQQPISGNDGYIDWTIDQQQEQSDGSISHYERSAYIMVEPDQVLGRIYDPTTGTDGRDVLGQTIKAHDGKALNYRFDETIIRVTSGDLIAQAEGVLRRFRDRATINQVIEIDEYVDFSTGNIEFNGDIIVKKGVRDCFCVEATGNVDVKGLIEAATIKCGNDLLCSGGFAGRETGTATIGGNIVGRYLDQIKGIVEGNVMIDREIINCDMLVHGNVFSEHGAIIGGKTIVRGELHIGTLGSGAGVTTKVILGSVPKLDHLAAEMKEVIEKLETQKQQLLEEQDMINRNTRRLTADLKERQTEIMFDLMNADSYLGKGNLADDALVQCIAEQRTVDVHIARKLNAGVILHIGHTLYKITTEMKGPVRIYLDARGEPHYANEGGVASGKLAQICEVKVLAA